MAKTRSPNYPTTDLAEALSAIRPVFKVENRNKMSRLVLAKDMGYKSLNGRALSKIGALRAYRLIEGSGDDLRVTDDAITLMNAPEGAPEQRSALERCAFGTDLFTDLRNEFPDTNPSLENLRFNLIKRGFTQAAAEKAAANYLSTVALVLGSPGGYNSAATNEEPSGMLQTPTHSKPSTPPALGIQRADFPLAEGVARIEFPADMSPESYEDLDAWVKLVLRRAKRGVKEGS